jgi:acetoin utilization deacetylase AcuC-like enzyme
MRFGFNDTCLEHDPGQRHPESPDRLRAIREGLKGRHGVSYVEADPASTSDVEAAHDADYVASIREFCETGGGEWDPDTVAVPETWPAALASAGLAAWAAAAALESDVGRRTPFSLGRPPGHHATDDDAMGFCFLNNAAVATEYARRETDADRVAILDWDVHHGNGIQDIFYDREEVFYGSVHEEGLYPGTGAVDETGADAGVGTTVNVPLPQGGGDPTYRAVFEEVFAPAVAAFDPDLLLVSAGFDAHRHDPISRMHVSTDGYGMLAQSAASIATDADAGLGFLLEGGYGLDTLSESIGMVHETFDGYEPMPDEGAVDEAVRAVIDDLRADHPSQGLGSK